MKQSQQNLQGLIIVVITIVMFLGSLIAALAEGKIGGRSPAPLASETGIVIPSATSPPQASTTSAPEFLSPTPSQFSASPTNLLPSLTATSQVTQPLCNSPNSWVPIISNFGDSLEEIATQYGITVEELKTANCLTDDTLPAGAVLFVPGSPASTDDPDDCGRPPGYIQYTVQRGDTLYSLSKAFGVSVTTLQQVNCMGSSTNIVTGTKLWVPNTPTRTPTSAKQPAATAALNFNTAAKKAYKIYSSSQTTT